MTAKGNTVAVLKRAWKNEDRVLLHLPMKVSTSSWFENSVAVERGPLVYGLKMREDWQKKESFRRRKFPVSENITMK